MDLITELILVSAKTVTLGCMYLNQLADANGTRESMSLFTKWIDDELVTKVWYRTPKIEQDLSKLNTSLFVPANATEALESMAIVTPEIVFCDVIMPVHDGLWLLERIHAGHAFAWTVIPGMNHSLLELQDGLSANLLRSHGFQQGLFQAIAARLGARGLGQ